MNQPFEGIKILDLSWGGVGPLVTGILANHGATVVRVESATRPGPDRTLAPYKDFRPGINRSGYAAMYGHNKYSLALNYSHPAAIDLIKRFVKNVDIVAEAFAPGFLEGKGLGYKDLKKIRPDLIMFHTSMQGHSGPHAHIRGLGFILTSLSGIANLTGWPDSSPYAPLSPYTDYLAPWIGACALLGALDYRDRTGQGAEIDHSQLESILYYLMPNLLKYQLTGIDQRIGNRSAQASPNGAYPCKGDDRWCTICIKSEDNWKAFCEVIGMDWAKDEKFATLEDRRTNEAELDRLIGGWTKNFAPEELMRRLQSNGIPAGVVQIPDEIYRCPQLSARDYWWTTDVMEIGPFPVPMEPFHMSRTPALRNRGTASLGGDTEFVCKKVFGMFDEEFDELLLEGLFE